MIYETVMTTQISLDGAGLSVERTTTHVARLRTRLNMTRRMKLVYTLAQNDSIDHGRHYMQKLQQCWCHAQNSTRSLACVVRLGYIVLPSRIVECELLKYPRGAS